MGSTTILRSEIGVGTTSVILSIILNSGGPILIFSLAVGGVDMPEEKSRQGGGERKKGDRWNE